MIRSSEHIGRCISADDMQNSSSIATAARTEIWLCRYRVKGYPCVPDAIYQDSAS